MRAMRGGVPAGRRWLARGFHFASPSYHASLLPAVAANRAALRDAAIFALDNTNPTLTTWHWEPVCSMLNGKLLDGGAKTDTRDAFGAANGAQLLASKSELALLTEHVTTFAPPRQDLREPVR